MHVENGDIFVFIYITNDSHQVHKVCVVGTNPVPEPVMNNYELDSCGIVIKTNKFTQKWCISKCSLQNWLPFNWGPKYKLSI